jgi:hypothetical protein
MFIIKLPCLAVKPIEIYPDEMVVVIDGHRLNVDEINSFSYHDGFDDVYDFFDFFRRYPPEVRENELEVIYWVSDSNSNASNICSLGYDMMRG